LLAPKADKERRRDIGIRGVTSQRPERLFPIFGKLRIAVVMHHGDDARRRVRNPLHDGRRLGDAVHHHHVVAHAHGPVSAPVPHKLRLSH